jgi:hypothetical protein
MGEGSLKMMISSPQWGQGPTMDLAGGGMFHDVETLMAISAWGDLGRGCLHAGNEETQHQHF